MATRSDAVTTSLKLAATLHKRIENLATKRHQTTAWVENGSSSSEIMRMWLAAESMDQGSS